MPFQQLGLSPELCLALAKLEYSLPTPIQAKAIPVILQGRDLLACAQTGTGKTAAFALPLLDRLLPGPEAATRSPRRPRALILVPTRELAAQVHETLRDCGTHKPLKSVVIFGGVGMQPQVTALAKGVDVVVATPGRLIDHMRQRTLDLSCIEILVLDEADRLLDMGFLPDLQRILRALPRERQTLLLSATLSSDVKRLAGEFTREPVEVEVAAANSVAETVSHQIHHVNDSEKREVLVRLLSEEKLQTLIFCRTKRGTDRLCKYLRGSGIPAESIHGDRSQGARTAALAGFKSRRTNVLVATDIAARGLDIEHLPLVVNFDLPAVAGDYIHRIGRTGRAGMSGRAVSLVGNRDGEMLREIQRLLSTPIETAPALRPTKRGASEQGQQRHRDAAPPQRRNRPSANGDRGQSRREHNGRAHVERKVHSRAQFDSSPWLESVV